MSLPGALIIIVQLFSVVFCVVALYVLYSYLTRFSIPAKYRIVQYLKLTYITYVYLIAIVVLAIGSVIFFFSHHF